MSGYIGSKSSVVGVDGYSRTEADATFVKPNDSPTLGTVTANQFVGGGAIILVGDQFDTTNYQTTSTSFQVATRFQITPSSSTSQVIGWFYCQMKAQGNIADGDMANAARVYYFNSSSSWTVTGTLSANLTTENGTSTGVREVSATLPVLLNQGELNASGVWDVAIHHYAIYDATSNIDDGRFYYMEYEP